MQSNLSVTGQSALRDIAFAWSQDGLAEQSLVAHPLSWRGAGSGVGRRIARRYLSLFWRPEFSVLVQEHIGTFLEGDDIDPLGSGHRREDRTTLGSLILPPTESAHEKLKGVADLTATRQELDWLWSRITLGGGIEPLLELDDPMQPADLLT